jgi:RNA polymerase sigma factor (sigma-70 family)
MTASPGGASFRTTRWSVLRTAGGAGEPARAALDELARTYWYPLYAYGRRLGQGREAAMDLVQGFFAQLLERGELQHLQPELGRFRAFLKVAFRNFHHNARKGEQAGKRGGGKVLLEADVATGDVRYALEPGHGLTPEVLFDRAFAQATLEQALSLIGEQYRARGQQQVFAALVPVLNGAEERTYEQLGAELGMGAVAVKVAVHRLRRRFGEQLRELVADTVVRPEEIDEELAALRAVFADPPGRR